MLSAAYVLSLLPFIFFRHIYIMSKIPFAIVTLIQHQIPPTQKSMIANVLERTVNFSHDESRAQKHKLQQGLNIYIYYTIQRNHDL